MQDKAPAIEKAIEVGTAVQAAPVVVVAAAEVGGAAAVRAAATAVRAGAERLAVRAQVAMMNSPRASFAAGFAAGFGRNFLPSGSPQNMPKPVLPTPAMAAGYKTGEMTGRFAKLVNELLPYLAR